MVRISRFPRKRGNEHDPDNALKKAQADERNHRRDRPPACARLRAKAAKADEDDRFVADNYKALKAAGLVEAGVPVELGGRGAEIAELCDMIRTIAQGCGSTGLAFSMHTHQVAIPAWRWRHQKVAAVEPLLKRVAAEKIILLSSGGSDWIGGSGKAEKVDGGYRITARKVFTSGAEAGDVLMTGAILEGETPAKVLHFGVPMKAPEVTVVDTWRTLGMRGTGSNDVVIDGLFIPDAGVALARNAGEWHPLFQVIATVAFPLIYAAYLGVAESARDIAIELAKKKPANPHLVNLAGRMDTSLRAAQLAHRHMVATVEQNAPSAAVGQRDDDGPRAGRRARHQGRRAGAGACRRRRLLPRQRAGAALPRHPGRALPPAAAGTAGDLCRLDGARPAGRQGVLTASLVAILSSTAWGRGRLRSKRRA